MYTEENNEMSNQIVAFIVEARKSMSVTNEVTMYEILYVQHSQSVPRIWRAAT